MAFQPHTDPHRPPSRRAVLLFLALFVLGLLLQASVVFAQSTLMVDDDGADCPAAGYSTIQAAVDAAQPGDTVQVCAGIYHESVRIATAAHDGMRVLAQDGHDVVVDGERLLRTGFVLDDVRGVVLAGFTVRRFVENISLVNADGNLVRDVSTSAASRAGVVVRGSDGNVVERVTSFENEPTTSFATSGRGILVEGGSGGNVVRHSRTYGNGFGIQLLGAGPDNVIEYSQSRDNVFQGIANDSTKRSTIRHNTSVDNQRNGIVVSTVHGDSSPQSVTVEHNHLSGNGFNGVSVIHGSQNSIGHNLIDGNAQDGIFIHESYDNRIEENHSTGNHIDGIGIKDHPGDPRSARNLVVGNHMGGNAEHDCHDDTFGDGTAGTANLWTNDKGLTEIRAGLCRRGIDVPAAGR